MGGRCIAVTTYLCCMCPSQVSFFLLNDPAPSKIYTLSLHDALPIYFANVERSLYIAKIRTAQLRCQRKHGGYFRSEEHTSELQSHHDLVCRLLLEKKKNHYTHFLLVVYNFTSISSAVIPRMHSLAIV